MYERVFQVLKNKIESGRLPPGAYLPSRAELALAFDTSEKTIRHALALLEAEGLIETAQRKKPVVADRLRAGHAATTHALNRIDAKITSDVLKTGVLLCYPVIKTGIARCARADFEIPRRILEHMDVDQPASFWKLSKQFYRFFVARNENALILQAVDSLGLNELDPVHDSAEMRARYYGQLCTFLETLEAGGAPESVRFDDMSGIYGIIDGMPSGMQVASGSPLLLGRMQLEQTLRETGERYSTVYMDLIGLIAVGRYRKGDRLPSHQKLQVLYGVGLDTTTKAVQVLRDLGVVRTVRGSGIFVAMDQNEIRKVPVPAHFVLYLDSLELLSLTAEGAAACAAAQITQPAIQEALAEMDRQWNLDYVYGRTPAILLELIAGQIGIEALSVIYALLQRNFRIGRSIPGLMTTEKTWLNCEIHAQCVQAVEALAAGDPEGFAQQSAAAFARIYRATTQACKQLGYYDAACGVYQGATLWK